MTVCAIMYLIPNTFNCYCLLAKLMALQKSTVCKLGYTQIFHNACLIKQTSSAPRLQHYQCPALK